MTFFPEQSITAVSRPVRPYLPRLWKVADVLALCVARPSRILFVGAKRSPDRVQPPHKFTILTKRVKHSRSNSRHNVHVGYDVWRIGDLNSNLRNRRANWSHAVGNHIHGAPDHGARVQTLQRLPHLCRIFPVIRGTRILLASRADESPVFDSRYIGRIRSHQDAVRPLLRI